MQFAMHFVHDCYLKLSGVATFSTAMCHRVALRLENCKSISRKKLFPGV